MFKLKVDYNIAAVQKKNSHGWHDKHGVVLHETVSPNIMKSAADILSVSEYVAKKGYGIHGITDNDGHIAWASGQGHAVYWHTASQGHEANSWFVGIEQVSDVMVKYTSRTARIKAWFHMQPELNATAKLIAAIARAHQFKIVDNPGDPDRPGITTHYEVTQYCHVEGGHTDAWPSTKGGYYPKRLLIKLAKRYYALGYHF